MEVVEAVKAAVGNKLNQEEVNSHKPVFVFVFFHATGKNTRHDSKEDIGLFCHTNPVRS